MTTQIAAQFPTFVSNGYNQVMKFQKLLFVISLVAGLTLNAQDKEWFSSVPGDPYLDYPLTSNTKSYPTQNYLCWIRNQTPSILHLYNGNSWKKLISDSVNFWMLTMDEQNDSFVFVGSDNSQKIIVKLFDGNQWKGIDKLKHLDNNSRLGVSTIKFYRNKLYAIFLNDKFSSRLVEYDFKTNSLTTICTFQQNPLNEVESYYDKFEMHVFNNRLYISGA